MLDVSAVRRGSR